MLPTNALQTTRLNLEDTLQPVRPTAQVLDVLSEFVPGQKLLAQIQFQLANGAYRATIAQRDVTLALPFSAKAGDSLELDVVETEGRIAFAVSKQPGEIGKEGAALPASASTTLSRTGQLIGQLLQDSDTEQQKPAPLNAGEPVLKTAPTSSKDIAPALQQAISRSGLFYESHQAAWVGGKIPEAALRQEPQAQLSRASVQNFAGNATLVSGSAPHPPVGATLTSGAGGLPGTVPVFFAAPPEIAKPATEALDGPITPAKITGQPAELAQGAERVKAFAAIQGNELQSLPARSGSALPTDIAPLVQQQLASLANNVYPFQGAIWPGQQIFWEIVDENGGRDTPDAEETPRQWKTRLKLLLPSLGGIDATIQLDGNDVLVQMKTSEAGTQSKLKGGVEGLRSRLDLAGLRLTALEVKGYESDEPAS